ncbi:MAG TPA: tetratricopeptide repeat protein [Pirellulales bacterium]
MSLGIARNDLAPGSDEVDRHLALGNALLARKELAGAAASYRQVVALEPQHWIAQLKLAHVLKLSKEFDAALEILQPLALEQPENPLVHKEFGRVFFALEQFDDAIKCFRNVLQLNPCDAHAHHWLASIAHLRGNSATARQHFERTAQLNPLLRVAAPKQPASFSILLLFAPGAANTPPEALVEMAEYDSYFLMLLAGADYDVPLLQRHASLVVNLISDVDQAREILPVADALVERLGLPVINPPHKIMTTDRESIARLLAGIQFCCIPRVQFIPNEQLSATNRDELAQQFSLPLLVRVAGAHGGHDFEKIEEPPALASFLARHPAADFYLTQYVDYQSADGFFRKYRFIYVDGEILPYHLAIGSGWKVHHGTTDMAHHAWMQREEEAFLNDPAGVFDPQQFATLRRIQQAVGLDFCGIDCALDRQGNVVVFEVNASMLVHRANANFAYKTAHVDRIKTAFDAMLRNRVPRKAPA